MSFDDLKEKLKKSSKPCYLTDQIHRLVFSYYSRDTEERKFEYALTSEISMRQLQNMKSMSIVDAQVDWTTVHDNSFMDGYSSSNQVR